MGNVDLNKKVTPFQLIGIGLELAHQIKRLELFDSEIFISAHARKASELVEKWNKAFNSYVTTTEGC